ncbi:putative hemolysin [Yersinia bercovieri]|uniref:calcium-binding protein n=1 Tax=Yersinia bercovieri TaxID=634 RepID=UPI00061C69B2|nr:calcium-binding protein [Yersinia bercovieri]CNE87472.1 putative hemolysin [Yersinia bercovieri]
MTDIIHEQKIYEISPNHHSDKYKKITKSIDNKNNITLKFYNINSNELSIDKKENEHFIHIMDSTITTGNNITDTLKLNELIASEVKEIESITFIFCDLNGKEEDSLEIGVSIDGHKLKNFTPKTKRMFMLGGGSQHDDSNIYYRYQLINFSSSTKNTIILGENYRNQILGGSQDDIINTYDGNDSINSGAGDDIISAGGGNDYITGGAGNDTIHGGQGDDTIDGDEGNDTIHGEQGDDTIYGGEGNDTIHGGQGNNVIHGDDGDDVIYAEQGNNTIYGGNGNDTIHGGQGQYIIHGGSGDDIIHGEQGQGTIYGNDGDDTIYVGAGRWGSIIKAGTGNDYIVGSIQSDKISGGEGNDTIFGGDGADTISGGAGTDIIHGGDEMDYLMGDDGNDYISGDAGGEHFSTGNHLFGGSGNDMIFAGDGGDQIEGDGNNPKDNGRNNIGDDHLFGGKGNDELIGGRGNDFLAGGHGDDTYHFFVGDGVNIINEESGGNNILKFDHHFFHELKIERYGLHMLITSNKNGDNLRVLVKNQLSDKGPKTQWLLTKQYPGSDSPDNFRMEIPKFFATRSPDLGQITDSKVNDMLNKEREYGINKVSSIFNPKHTKCSKQNLAMLTQAISQQQESQSTSEFLPPHFIPKNVVNFLTFLDK